MKCEIQAQPWLKFPESLRCSPRPAGRRAGVEKNKPKTVHLIRVVGVGNMQGGRKYNQPPRRPASLRFTASTLAGSGGGDKEEKRRFILSDLRFVAACVVIQAADTH